MNSTKIAQHYKSFFKIGHLSLTEDDQIMIDWAQDLIKEAIAEHEQSLFPKATEANTKDGWTLDFDFVKMISDRTAVIIDPDGENYKVDMEEAEAVLIALRDRNLPPKYEPNKEEINICKSCKWVLLQDYESDFCVKKNDKTVPHFKCKLYEPNNGG